MVNNFPDAVNLYSVFELTTYIRQVVERDDGLQDVWVEGEMSSPKRPSSGHWYFTLKDDRSELKAVMWKTSAARQHYQPEHGQKVRAHGRISVYEARGDYQLLCDFLIPLDGIGDLHARFRQLWDKLAGEGLFDPEIKRPLPAFPRRIGVVTSPTDPESHAGTGRGCTTQNPRSAAPYRSIWRRCDPSGTRRWQPGRPVVLQ